MKMKVAYLVSKLMVAIVLIALLAFKASAGETPRVKLLSESADRAMVVLDNDAVISELSVEDLNGNMVYYKEGKINTTEYSKVFNFSNLKNGEYKVIAKNMYGTRELVFSLNNNKISVLNEKNWNDPYFRAENNILKISYLNRNQEPVSLTIHDGYTDIYTTNLGANFSITAGFDLSNLFHGEYTAVLSNGEKYYSYTFEK